MSLASGTEVRVLVCGAVRGNFAKFCAKISHLHKKVGPFECVFCVGEFFSEDKATNDDLSVHTKNLEVTVYIIPSPLRDNLETYCSSSDDIAPNVSVLPKCGVASLACGLNVASFAGVTNQSGSETACSDQEMLDMIQGAVCGPSGIQNKLVDLLITNQWPFGVTKYDISPSSSAQACSSNEQIASMQVSAVAAALKPRYHFTSSAQPPDECSFYERQPYRNHKVLAEGAANVTRFLGVGAYGNSKKEKAFYAFNIVPAKFLSRSAVTQQPDITTESPYLGLNLSTSTAIAPSLRQFFYDQNHIDTENRKRTSQDGAEHSQAKRGAPGPCWFCLSSQDVEKHLIVTIAESTYLAMAKGGLTPDHVLILPIDHVQCMAHAPRPIIDEVAKFKTALISYIEQSGDTITVFFERNFHTQHAQIQVVGIPKKCAPFLKEAFFNCADRYSIDLIEMPSDYEIGSLVNPGQSYFYVEVPSLDGMKLFARIEPRRRFPINFGREVLCCPAIMNTLSRVDWKDCCLLSVDDETDQTKSFRAKFAPFDFSEQEDTA